MKHSVFILFLSFLCCTKLVSQAAPDLRCLSVAANGNITLTWIPPADPGGQFTRYEIWADLSGAGTYALFGSINTLTTSTFVHTTTLSTVQSIYYYVLAYYGTNSFSSDTLHTMRLNVFSTNGAVDLKLDYNVLHAPELITAGTTFTINKEYPVGTWNVFAITPDIKYADTISVCNAHISYQVSLSDNSGCVSTSNVVSGIYTDLYRPGGPSGPYIDSISVLPDGTTTLAWMVPRDMDIIKYQIYHRANPSAPILHQDLVFGRLSTSYTYTAPDANTEPVSLFVAAVDSCSEDPGLYNSSPVTMYLRTNYDNCSYKTTLHWNAYQGMRDGILEYRIYYSVNGGSFGQAGSTQDTVFVHKNTVPGQNACYYVRVFNTTKTITASSNRACFFAGQVPASGFVYMRTATVLDKSSVLLKLYVDTLKDCRGLDIFRSPDGLVFSNIGFVPYVKQQPQPTFTDANARTNTQSYVYKAIVQDDCGNFRAVSNLCKTMLLKVADDQENIFTKHLSWNAYEGFNAGVSGYTIYRVINDAPGSPVGTTGSLTTSFTDDVENAASLGARVDYLVEAMENNGNIYGFLETSNSNTAAVYMEGAIYIPNAFAPTGHNTTWKPVTHFIDKTDYSVSVFDRWGHQVFTTDNDETAWDGHNCMPGVYAYLIRYKTSTGEYKEVKGTVLMLE